MTDYPSIIHRETKNKDFIIEAATTRIKYRDFFHLKNLYVTMHEWLMEEGWGPGDEDKFPEVYYLQKEDSKTGNEMWIFWRPEKVISNYIKFKIDIDWHMIAVREAEVMHEGQKFKTNWGEVEIKIWAKEIIDQKGEWENHWLLKNFHKIFIKRIFKPNIEAQKLELYRDAYRLLEAVKTYLKVRTYLPEPELQQFFPQLGLGTTK